MFGRAGRREGGGGGGDKNKRIRNENVEVLIVALTVSTQLAQTITWRITRRIQLSKELTTTAKFEAVFHARVCYSRVCGLATSAGSYTAPHVTQLQSQLVDAVQKHHQTLRATRA